MKFYNNTLNSRKYFKLLKKKGELFSKDFIFKNSAIFMGDKSFYRILMQQEILKKIKNVKGDIVEFGVWNGNNLFTIKKIIDFLKINKKIYGYDNFSGFPNPIGYNKKKSGKGIYVGSPIFIKYITNFFKFKKIEIIHDDILNLNKYLFKFKRLSYIYIDCNIYIPVKNILDLLNNKLSKGGMIAFDEGLNNSKSGEGKALKDFYSKNKKNYKLIKLKKGYQPDIILLKK